MKRFSVIEENQAVFIKDNIACHIDRENFTYEQGNKNDAHLLCQELNDLCESKMTFNEIMTIIHNIKYHNWKWSDLDDYIYKNIDLNELYKKYDNDL